MFPAKANRYWDLFFRKALILLIHLSGGEWISRTTCDEYFSIHKRRGRVPGALYLHSACDAENMDGRFVKLGS
jgi:hypothetical protein